MFLPLGKNNVIGTYEMLPQCVERILKMNGFSKNFSAVLVSILTVTPSNTAEKNKFGSSNDGCRTYPKETTISSKDKGTSYNLCT
jgi:hypothetical protein